MNAADCTAPGCSCLCHPIAPLPVLYPDKACECPCHQGDHFTLHFTPARAAEQLDLYAPQGDLFDGAPTR